MILPVLMAVACLMGIVLGYASARLGPLWMPWAIVAVSAVLLAALWMLMPDRGGQDGVDQVYLFMWAGAPYMFCLVVSALIGTGVTLVKRRLDRQ